MCSHQNLAIIIKLFMHVIAEAVETIQKIQKTI